MNTTLMRKIGQGVAIGSLLVGTPALAQDAASDATIGDRNPVTKSVQTQVDKKIDQQVAKEQEKVTADAVDALSAMVDAIDSLRNGDEQEAREHLTDAIGRFEVLTTRNPDLALAPVDTSVEVFDLYADEDAIKDAIHRVEKLLDDGEVQQARTLMADLASEQVVTVEYIPFTTYPDVLRRAVVILDDGNLDEAASMLEDEMQLVVVTSDVYPLPLLRTEVLLDEAKELAEKSERSGDESKRLTDLLDGADEQIRIGHLLGYFDKSETRDFRNEIKEIRRKTQGSGHGKGFFNRIESLFKKAHKKSSQSASVDTKTGD